MIKRTSLTLRSHAKLNLCLEVLRKRDDGYHDIATVFAALSLYDTVHVELIPLEHAARRVEICAEGWAVAGGAGNLAYRAACAFMLAAPPSQELENVAIRVRLNKRIPPGGGLGGGSSNAAAVLFGLNILLGQPLAADALQHIAAQLGSDVPFFVARLPAALALGRGEVIDLLPLPRLPSVVIAWPGKPVSTAWAYRQLTAEDFGTGCHVRRLAQAIAKNADLASRPDLGHNSFLQPIVRSRPDVLHLLHRLRDLGATVVSLAGSGACVWGIFADAGQALHAWRRLSDCPLWACRASVSAAALEVVE
jgi:4-diphosphocytidyl-2-C-methyl-D-erythritol kinase